MNPLINPGRLYPVLRSGSIMESGLTPLVDGQDYIDVIFPTSLPGTTWNVLCSVLNTTDPTPLNIWPGIVTAKSPTGFTLQLNGVPDSDNYYLYWAIAPSGIVPAATTYTLAGPSSGAVGTASSNFTAALPTGAGVPGTVIVTPSDGGGGGTFTPTTVPLTTAAPSATFTYTPASTGAKTISVTNSGALANPGSLTYTATPALLVDGDPVSTWPDSSGNGHDATMTGSNRPTFKTAIVNGKPVVRFTSAGQSKLNIATPISGAFPWIVFAVMKQAATGTRIDSLNGSDASGTPYGPLIVTANTLYMFTREGYVSDLTSISLGFHVLDGIHGGTGTQFLLIDGVANTSALTPSANTGNFTTIGYDSVTPTYSDGDIAEIIIYNASLAGTDRQNIEKYLGTKYGITVAGGIAVDPSTVSGLEGWWKADSLG